MEKEVYLDVQRSIDPRCKRGVAHESYRKSIV